MQVPLSWLREYIDVPYSPKELAHRLTMAGLEVGAFETIGASWENVIIGHVEATEPHPNAERLKLCTVRISSDTVMKVVCGAPNVAVGQNIAYAKVGAKLTDPETKKPTVLKAARIRGVVSEGMICSERELGLGDNHTGIMVLPADLKVGMSLSDVLGDTVLDAEPTANRPDWFSMLGVAHEVAAITGTTVRMPKTTYQELGVPIGHQVRVNIEADDLCPRYIGALVRGVKVGPSPAWMQQRLQRAGMRSINNVVDVTNYVMLEYGQPMHAFDFVKLKGRRIIVRRARQGEVIATLDGQEHKLNSEMLVIADERDAVAVAGVIGGANSDVTGSTIDILLESASFHPISVRKAAQTLKLRTEASLRFEKGLRPELPLSAMQRAIHLILQISGGSVASGLLDEYPGRVPPVRVKFWEERIERVLGVAVPMDEAERILTALGFDVREVHATEAMHVTVPPWRSDVTIEEDLIEELARIRGYDAVPLKPLATPIPLYEPNPARDLREHVRDLLAQSTLEEVITYSLTSEDALRKARVVDEHQPPPLKVANPLSADRDTLRTNLLPCLLATLSSNRRLQEGPLNLFEIGRVYLPFTNPAELPEEREIAMAVLCGPRTVPGWRHDDGVEDFYEAKGVAEALCANLDVPLTVEPATTPWCAPGRGATLSAGGIRIGFVGEVHPAVLEAFDIDTGPVAILEIDLPALLKATSAVGMRCFKPLPKFPGAWRDLAMLLDRDEPSAKVEKTLRTHPLVADLTVLDVYEGKQVPSGKKSLAVRILLQSPTRTLTGDEVNEAMAELWRALTRDVAAEQRA